MRPLSGAERDALKAGLRSSDAFTLRRSQILLASARGDTPPIDARQVGCASQTARNTIKAFDDRGLDALRERSHRNHTIHTTFGAAGLERLQALAHRSPRDFGHSTGAAKWHFTESRGTIRGKDHTVHVHVTATDSFGQTASASASYVTT